MLFVLIALIVCFGGCAVWFWFLSQAHIGHFTVQLSTNIERNVILRPTRPLIRLLKQVLAAIGKGLSIIGPYLFSLAICSGIILGVVYLFRSTFSLTTLETIILILSVIISIIISLFYGSVAYFKAPLSFLLPFKSAKYAGTVKLPKRVYEGDSQNISLVLQQRELVNIRLSEALEVRDETGRRQDLYRVLLMLRKDGVLEVELLAAGFTVNGDMKQRLSLTNTLLEYRWNCAFPNAGLHEITLVFRVLHESTTYSLGAIEQKVKVVKFDHATQRQVRLFAIIAGIAVFISTLLTIVTSIHNWNKP